MKTKKLTLAGVLIALATVLSLIPLYTMPNGGTVTPGSMVPIVLFSMMVDFKWGIVQALVYGLIQMVIGGVAPPVNNFISFLLIILLDYIIAFGVLGLAGVISRKLGDKVVGTAAATLLVLLLRFLCHFASGIIIWGVYAPEGQAAWLYSLLYNGGYMLLETIITMILVLIIRPRIKIEL